MASNALCDSLKPDLDQLPKEPFWEVFDLYQWEGFWYFPDQIEHIKAFQSQFEARDDDIIIASSMRTGTTWLKALCVCIMGSRDVQEAEEDDLLVQKNPHAHVLNLENTIYYSDLHIDPSFFPSPRLFQTHMPYNSLPNSIKEKECKIVYVTRSPKDTLISLWYFFNQLMRPNQEPLPLEKAFESFCNGVHVYGPFFDHLLQYWTESLNMPHKILILKYEELKRDPKGQVKRLASFLGRPFVKEDEIDKVLWRCSLERLKNLDINQTSGGTWMQNLYVSCSSFFRQGNVGDWKKHFTPEMGERLDQLAREKLEGTGFDFEI